MSISRRQLLKAASMWGSLLLAGCQRFPFPIGPKPECDDNLRFRIRPGQIASLYPSENTILPPLDREMPPSQAHVLEIELGNRKGQSIDFPSSVKLFFDGKEVTQEASFRSGCPMPQGELAIAALPVCGWVRYQIKGPLKLGKHVAGICFNDIQGEKFCYDWFFYLDPGDDSGLRNLCPGDRVVPRQMGISSPDHNEMFLTTEEVLIWVGFVKQEILSLDSVRVFLDDQEVTALIQWGQPPLRRDGYTSFVHRIPPGMLVIGKHIVRIEFHDELGATISYDWNFYIQQAG